MKFHNPTADVFIPDSVSTEEAWGRITHLGVGAHADDLEFMAFHGIVAGFEKRSFAGVTCTDGAGTLTGLTAQQMIAVRRQEQKQAATLERYGVMVQLDYPSRSLAALPGDLRQVFAATHPQVVYTHNPADKHDTHIGVLLAVLQAIHALPASERPGKLYGCEVWRDLDSLPDNQKVVLDVSDHDELAAKLNAVFVSQIAGGKRYDLAVAGRRRANATFLASHAADQSTAVTFAMDLTPLMSGGDVTAHVADLIEQFKADVYRRLRAVASPA